MNKKDFEWHIVRTLPNQERKLVSIFEANPTDNILEVYCPTRTTATLSSEPRRADRPLFAGYVFVLSTQQALVDFLRAHYSDGKILYRHRDSITEQASIWTVPDSELKEFRDFNENYAQDTIVLERPYSDYATNVKSGEPNDIVKILDGPLAGKTGYLVRFRGERRLVFRIADPTALGSLTVSIPNLWDFHAIRLFNADGDKQILGTKKARAADILIGIIQATGHEGGETSELFDNIIETLRIRPSFADLRKKLAATDDVMADRIKSLTANEAELILHLVRYEQKDPGFAHASFAGKALRPFLTPTPGVIMDAGQSVATLRHDGVTEIISRQIIPQHSYSATRDEEHTDIATYFAHTAVYTTADGHSILTCNWDSLLSEYFRTADEANQRLVSGTHDKKSKDDNEAKLVESFRNYAPTLSLVLTGQHPTVRAIRDLDIACRPTCVLATDIAEVDPKDIQKIPLTEPFRSLMATCIAICSEISETTHLAVWRRLLQGIWLVE